MSADVLTGGESRAVAREADRILNGPSPISQVLPVAILLIMGLTRLLLGPAHQSVVMPVGIVAAVALLTPMARLYHLGRTPERIEAALVQLARCSDTKALHVLVRFVIRPERGVEETVHLTERHLPMARRALADEKRFNPGGLPAWVETLRQGVVSEDLEFVARRIAELDSVLNTDVGVWLRRLVHRAGSDRSG